VDGPGQRAPRAGLEVVRPADEVGTVVGAVVPEDLVRTAAPRQATALLPVPGCRLADLRPLVVVLKVDVANLPAVGGRHVALLKVDLHGQRVPARLVELQAVVEPEARVGRPVLRPGVGHPDDGRVPQLLAFDDFLPALARRVCLRGIDGQGVQACGGVDAARFQPAILGDEGDVADAKSGGPDGGERCDPKLTKHDAASGGSSPGERSAPPSLAGNRGMVKGSTPRCTAPGRKWPRWNWPRLPSNAWANSSGRSRSR